jgi:hypothetical protein
MVKAKTTHVEMNNPTVIKARDYIKMVGMGDLLGCTLIGPAGMGKTHLVRNTLDEMGIEYEVYGGHISLAGCYEFLQENANKLIFFDDVSNVINKDEIIELFKQALNISGHQRMLHYRSKGVLSPHFKPHFEFTGRCIFAFNDMDTKNPNVKAIIDRAPKIELKFSRKEIIEGMYKIAEGDGGGLLEHEKMIITREIENHTDITMDVSFRKQQICFNIYKSFKKLYGENNLLWKQMVHQAFGKKKRSWIHEFLKENVGDGTMPRIEFAKAVAIAKDMSLRTAQRRIQEAIEMEEVYQNKLKFGDLSIKPFGGN